MDFHVNLDINIAYATLAAWFLWRMACLRYARGKARRVIIDADATE